MTQLDKQKRKRENPDGRNPTLFLVAGIVIGIFIAALAVAMFLFVGRSETQIDSSMPPVVATEQQAQAQSVQIQPTVIANRVSSAKLSPNNRFLASIIQEGGRSKVYLAQLSVERNLSNLQRDTLLDEVGYYNDVIFSPSGDRLVITSEQNATLIFDTATHEILETLSPYSHAAFSPDGTMLALGGNADGLRILDTSNFSLREHRQLDEPYIGGLAFNNQNQLAVAVDHIQVWNPLDLNAPPNPYPVDAPIHDITFHPNGEWLAVASDGAVYVINITNSERKVYTFETRQIRSVDFSADGEWLAAGGGDSGLGIGKLYAFRWNQSDVIPPDPAYYEVREFAGNNHTIFDVSFTRDGLLLSASWDGSVRLWDVETGEEISRLQQ